jgi:hypothetical protein
LKPDRPEYRPIIEKLLERTRQGRVRWAGSLGTFSCTVGSTSEKPVKFTLSTTATRDISYDERFLVMDDANGNELFRVASNDLPTSPEEEAISNMVNELYQVARRQALKSDVELDRVLTLLDRA